MALPPFCDFILNQADLNKNSQRKFIVGNPYLTTQHSTLV